MRRKRNRTSTKRAEKTESPKPSHKSTHEKKTYSSENDSEDEVLSKCDNKEYTGTRDTSQDEIVKEIDDKTTKLARVKVFEESNYLEDDSTKGKCNISNESSTATVEDQTESENAQVASQSPQANDANANKSYDQNQNPNIDEIVQPISGEHEEHEEKEKEHAHDDLEHQKYFSPERACIDRKLPDRHRSEQEDRCDRNKQVENDNQVKENIQDELPLSTSSHENGKEVESLGESATNLEFDNPEQMECAGSAPNENVDNQKSSGDLKREEQKQKKITLRRSVDEVPISEENKYSRKITLKRNIDSANTQNKEQSEEINKQPYENTRKSTNQSSTTEEWVSVYAFSDTAELKNKPLSKRIILKKLASGETLTYKKKDHIVIKRRISLVENSSSKSTVGGSPQVKKRSLSERSSIEALEKPLKPHNTVKLNRNVLCQDPEAETTELGQTSDNIPNKKHRKWGPTKISSYTKIDVDSLKIVCPILELVPEADINLSVTERRTSCNTSFEDDSDQEKENTLDIEKEGSENIIALNRKISIVDDTASKLRPPPSPSRNPVSEVLYITNLVRPFTVKQLKDLLERTGKIKNDGFWTDRIKSKCYVQYENIEDAGATRNALHGINWPSGNGKKLNIEYATVEDLEHVKNPPALVVKERTPDKENKPTIDSAQSYNMPDLNSASFVSPSQVPCYDEIMAFCPNSIISPVHRQEDVEQCGVENTNNPQLKGNGGKDMRQLGMDSEDSFSDVHISVSQQMDSEDEFEELTSPGSTSLGSYILQVSKGLKQKDAENLKSLREEQHRLATIRREKERLRKREQVSIAKIEKMERDKRLSAGILKRFNVVKK